MLFLFLAYYVVSQERQDISIASSGAFASGIIFLFIEPCS